MRKTTTSRGYGWKHQQQRERLLRSHRDGTSCDWCGRPMYKASEKNWDGQPLAADHTQSIKHGGAKADRLMCATCNKQRSSGEWDHLSPLATGVPPEQWSRPGHRPERHERGMQPVNVTFA